MEWHGEVKSRSRSGVDAEVEVPMNLDISLILFGYDKCMQLWRGV
jgi:hypothetical protein